MELSESRLPPRTRNAGATRTAILEAARAHFMERSYEQVGVRDIAASAGINVALVIRYFGSKEQLFAEALTEGFGLEQLVAGERASLGVRLARYLLQKEVAVAGQFNPMVALLRSLGTEHGAALFRHVLDEQFIRPFAAYLGGEQAALRASLIASTMTGLVIARTVVQSEVLNDTELDTVVNWVAPIFQSYIDGSLPNAAPDRQPAHGPDDESSG